MTATGVTVLLICLAGVCEFTAATIAYFELRAGRRQALGLEKGPFHGTPYEGLGRDQFTNIDQYVVANAAMSFVDFLKSNRRGRMAITVLVPAGIALGTAGDILGAVR